MTKDGNGRLYYRLGMKYAARNLQQEPLERGFSVDRFYAGEVCPNRRQGPRKR